MLNNLIPDNYIEAGQNLWMDPATGKFHSINEGQLGGDNQFAWGDNGIQALGGVDANSLITPFLGIQEQYRGGNAIDAETWQQAVSKSLEGFMRANYGADPIFNWQPGQSGINPDSQFQIGTLQELANAGFPGMFFDTSGPTAMQRDTGQMVSRTDPTHSTLPAGSFDPLLGMSSDTKLLGFEDIPYEQLEKAVGGLPGQILTFDTQRRALGEERVNLIKDLYSRSGVINPDLDPDVAGQMGRRINELDAQLAQLPSPFITLEEARSRGDLQDYNDYIFQLNIDQYREPDEIIKATPESVLQNFFDLPQYRLNYGNEPGVLDPYASPHERFRADPGYQFMQDEGMRNIQRNSAAKGLLESGATQRDLQEYGQNLADQSYQRFQAQNNALFSDWQNQLRGVSSQGAQLSSQSAANALNTGGNLANISTSQGSNLANLYANQGVFGGNAFLNTGGAQANTAMQAASLDAQILAAQMEAEASVYSAQLQAQAASASAGAAGGGGGGLGGLGSIIGAVGGLFGF